MRHKHYHTSTTTSNKTTKKKISPYICAGVVFENISVPHLVTTVILNHFKPTNKKLDPNVMWSDIRGSRWGSVVGKRC